MSLLSITEEELIYNLEKEYKINIEDLKKAYKNYLEPQDRLVSCEINGELIEFKKYEVTRNLSTSELLLKLQDELTERSIQDAVTFGFTLMRMNVAGRTCLPVL